MVKMVNGGRTATDVGSRPPVRKEQDGSSRHYAEAQWAATSRNSSTASLVWCWHPKSNWTPPGHGTAVDGMDVLPPQLKPDPYFTLEQLGQSDSPKSQQEDPGGNQTNSPRIRSPISLKPRLTFRGREKKAPGTHCLHMCKVYGAISSIICWTLSLPHSTLEMYG